MAPLGRNSTTAIARGPRLDFFCVVGGVCPSSRLRERCCAAANVNESKTNIETQIARRANLRYRYGDMATNKKAPEFTLPDENGNPVSLEQFRGKTVVLFFYPRANTPG